MIHTTGIFVHWYVKKSQCAGTLLTTSLGTAEKHRSGEKVPSPGTTLPWARGKNIYPTYPVRTGEELPFKKEKTHYDQFFQHFVAI